MAVARVRLARGPNGRRAAGLALSPSRQYPGLIDFRWRNDFLIRFALPSSTGRTFVRAQYRVPDIDPGYMSRKIRKFRTDKFDT